MSLPILPSWSLLAEMASKQGQFGEPGDLRVSDAGLLGRSVAGWRFGIPVAEQQGYLGRPGYRSGHQ